MPRVFWIDTGLPGRLAVMPRPLGGEGLQNDLNAVRSEGADIVVSLLGRYETELLELGSEAACCQACSMRFLAFPIEDRGLPSERARVKELASGLLAALQDGKGVAVHCRMGIGRSSLIAACVLVLSGMDASEAFHRIEQARGLPVPDTHEQKMWVAEFQRVTRASG